PVATLPDRVRHVIQSAFNGRRITIFSGGEAKDEAAVLEEVKGLAQGGSFGSIMGRNAFQRTKADAVKLLKTIQGIYKEAA
ncbi:fructose-bisphosphate aldolase, partial [bacterium]|nr:fructose-bisphosphate aldolase [bacterium]